MSNHGCERHLVPRSKYKALPFSYLFCSQRDWEGWLLCLVQSIPTPWFKCCFHIGTWRWCYPWTAGDKALSFGQLGQCSLGFAGNCEGEGIIPPSHPCPYGILNIHFNTKKLQNNPFKISLYCPFQNVNTTYKKWYLRFNSGVSRQNN